MFSVMLVACLLKSFPRLGWSTTLVQTEISPQKLDRLLFHTVHLLCPEHVANEWRSSSQGWPDSVYMVVGGCSLFFVLPQVSIVIVSVLAWQCYLTQGIVAPSKYRLCVMSPHSQPWSTMLSIEAAERRTYRTVRTHKTKPPVPSKSSQQEINR